MSISVESLRVPPPRTGSGITMGGGGGLVTRQPYWVYRRRGVQSVKGKTGDPHLTPSHPMKFHEDEFI